MKNLILVMSLIANPAWAKCRCFEKPEPPKKPITTVVVQIQKPAAVALPGLVKDEKKEEKVEPAKPVKPEVIPVVQIPDPDEPANLKGQAIRAGVMCAATLAVLLMFRNTLSLKPIVEAVEKLNRNKEQQ